MNTQTKVKSQEEKQQGEKHVTKPQVTKPQLKSEKKYEKKIDTPRMFSEYLEQTFQLI